MEEYEFDPSDSRDEVHTKGQKETVDSAPPQMSELSSLLYANLSSYDQDCKQKLHGESGEFCDGPTTRTRSKIGQSTVDDIPSSFLVQIPHYAYKPEKNKKCQVCGKHARTPSDLLRHMRVHTGERPFPCVACDKTFKCKRSQLTHQYLSHGIKDGLSEHRLDVLDHRKVKRNSSKLKDNFANQVPLMMDKIMHNSFMKQKTEQPTVIDQDEDTEILAGEEISSTSEGPVNFVGLFSSQKENGTSPIENGNENQHAVKEEIQEPVNTIKQECDTFLEKQCNISENEKTNNNPIFISKKKKKDRSKKVPILRIKTHKCTHCKRQFRSIYTLRYHLRSMHDEKVYLSPALESRLKKRRWIPPHVRLQKSKLSSTGLHSHNKKESILKEKTQNKVNYSFLPTYPNEEIEQKFFSQVAQSFTDSSPQLTQQSRTEDAIDLHVNSNFTLEIKKEKVDTYEDDVNNNISGAGNVKNDRNLRGIMSLNENEIKQMPYYSNTLPNSTANTTGTAFTMNNSNANASNPFVLPPHIFFPSTPAAEEGLNEKPISWESLQVTSESILISKLEAVHPGTQQKYVLYKCGLCGKAFASLRVICGHLALHNDASKEKDCEKCGASFKWRTELDSHLECHQASDRKFVPTSPYLPSYYVNPFPIPVVTPSEQNVMSTTRLLPYPFFPMPQQIPPLMQPGFFPFFAAALQPQMQSGANNHEENARNISHSPHENDPTTDNFEDKSLGQGCTFQCKLCPKTFDRIFSLQRHERIHSGVKACFCKICGRGFSELRNLRHHIIRFHAESAQKEPLPYRRRPNRMRNVSSSQKLVSFLKKTAVRILNSMGQNKLDPMSQAEVSSSSVKIQTDATQELEKNEPQNLSASVPTTTADNLLEQNALVTMPKLFDATSHMTELSPSQELNEAPPPKLSPGLAEVKDIHSTNDSDVTGTNGAVEVMQDPKRSLLGNRRKGRPFKLSTMSCNALSLGGDDLLFPMTDNGFFDKHPEALSESSLLQATEVLNGCLKTEVAFPQLNYFNVDPQPNEPIDMRNPNAKEKATITPKKEAENNEVQERSISFPSDNGLGLNMFSDPNQSSTSLKLPESFESRCLFPCSYCHKSFNSITDINRHMSFHADIRPFKCPYCSYCSRTNSQLKVHMMRHEGIKHYMCQICNYNGVTQSDLNRHLKTRTHLLRSRNVCACCGTGFHTRSLSDEHYKSCHMSANSNNQDKSTKNQPEPANKSPSSSNRNRVTRLKQFRTPEEKIKNEFYQKLCDLNNMGLTLGDFLQQNPNAANLEK